MSKFEQGIQLSGWRTTAIVFVLLLEPFLLLGGAVALELGVGDVVELALRLELGLGLGLELGGGCSCRFAKSSF